MEAPLERLVLKVPVGKFVGNMFLIFFWGGVKIINGKSIRDALCGEGGQFLSSKLWRR